MIIFVAICRMVALVFYVVYDMRCIIYEQASVINCHQDAMIQHEYAVFVILAWVLLSILGSAAILLVVLCCRKVFNFQKDKAKNIHRKGSFWPVAFLCSTAISYHGYRTSLVTSGLGRAISISLMFWMVAMFLDLCCLNYTPRVQWRGCTCYEKCLQRYRKNTCWYFYWISLITSFLEASYMWVAVALNVAHELAPLIEKEYPDEPRIKGLIMIGLGFNLAFHSHLVSFFWNKMFHGDKDLLSDPGSKLIKNKSSFVACVRSWKIEL